jgi:DNA polymerase I
MPEILPSEELVLVDGSSYLFRAYYAMPPLTNAAGLPTGAIYGVINMLKRLLKDYAAARVVVVFDPKGKTKRHEVYAEYKANRAQMPDELGQQIEPLHKLIRALGLPLVVVPGVEADDVIGTLAKQAEQQGSRVIISTGDKDLAQLVNESITLVNTMNDKVMDIDGVKEKFGVLPSQIIDYLALVGDSSDNIPGVNKVGPKTAVKWLTQYDSVAGIVEHADEIKGKVGEYLREAIASGALALSQQLVTLDCQVDVSASNPDISTADADELKLKDYYTELEFSNWLADLGQSGEKQVQTQADYDIITTKDGFGVWYEKLQKAEVIAFDTETTSLDPLQAELVGLSFSVEAGKAAYVPLAHDYEGVPVQLDKVWVLDQLTKLLNDAEKLIIGQNLKYDIQVMHRAGVSINAQHWDTLLASHLLGLTSKHDMDTLARQHLGHETTSFEAIAGKGAKQLTFNQITIEVAGPYAAEDADITLQLYHFFQPQIDSGWAKSVFYDIELPLMRVLAQMELIGVLIDSDLLAQQSQALASKIKIYQEEIFSLAGEEFNISSPKQLQVLLFEKLQLPVLKKTPKGQPSTAEKVLQQLARDYPLPKLILAYRSAAKLKSTYTDSLPKQVDAITGRVHTHYHQTVTATGRLSSTNPNLQNIPIRNEDGRKVRQAFIVSAGNVLLAADYSQVELRIMAHLSQDPGLLQAFSNGVDVHSATAAEVFSVDVDLVSSDQRRKAKAINFGLIYGMSAFGLAQQLDIERREAQDYIDRYFKRYPGVKAYMEKARAEASAQGYVKTLLGRRLFTPEINSSNGLRRKAAERAAINAPLQGSAAEIIKVAMIHVAAWLQDSACETKMLMQVHDELVFSVNKEKVDEAIKHIRQYMEGAVNISVPLEVSIGQGSNWDSAH